MSKRRDYVFTLNNYTEDHCFNILQLKCKYVCFGKEIAPTTCTPHLQGYIYFVNPIAFNSVRHKLPPGSHIEPAKATPAQNRTYCSKEGNFVELGELPEPQGKRNDIHSIKEFVLEAPRTELDIYLATTSCQAAKFGTRLMQLSFKQRDWMPRIYWYYGKTGTGKSSAARERFPAAFWKESNTWNGYQGESTVVWDDFRPDNAKFVDLLKWFDRYPCQVNVKFGHQQLLFTDLIITAPAHPEDFYDSQSEDYAQLKRRLFDIVEYINW